MPRVLAVLALLIAPLARAQDTDSGADSSYAFDDGAAAVAGDEGGRPACACDAVGPVQPLAGLVLAALIRRRR